MKLKSYIFDNQNLKFMVIPNTLKVVLSCGLLSAALFLACSKERIEDPPQNTLNSYSSPNAYLDSKKQQEQVFVIDSTGNGPIIGNQGTRIHGSKNCLQMPNGDSVSYPFTIKLVELYKPKDMIYYRMPTVANQQILKTDGEVRIRAFKGNEELSLRNNGCAYLIQMPDTAPVPNMDIYYGFDAGGGTYTDWTTNLSSLGVTSSLPTTFTTDSIGYAAYIPRLGWVNCDKDASQSSSGTVSFNSTVDDLSNVAKFIYLRNTKTVIQVYGSSSVNIPLGSDVNVILIAYNSSGTLCSFTHSFTLVASSTVDVTMSETTDAALTSYLDAL